LNIHYRSLEPDDIKDCKNNNGFALDVLNGLTKDQKMIPCKYFYNKKGEQLFRRITELPEYYLTNCEFEILHKYKNEITDMLDVDNFNLVELGAGDGKKTKVLLEHFSKLGLNVTYIPIDICESAMKNLIYRFQDYPIDITIDGLVAEYFQGLKWLSHSGSKQNFVLFLGSNIGNFGKDEARLFFHKLWNSLNADDFLLIGFDLKKDIDLLNKAYNDSENITEEFNLNLLLRINDELGGNFNLNAFNFYSGYDVQTGAVESYLVSKKAQTVQIDALNQSFTLKKFEPIHTESSYKYLKSDIKKLAESAGFDIVRNFSDTKNYFLDSLWRVRK
jgi:dimethylhistidine N-methyltransferase